ncbi:M15 family metallopeptidase [Candidatus Dojkabacteria bacterium]|jgi:D-alanyl-D-alanine carboxypeptidase|nr:M15 family metallopeptidase [Candidatus Dojkabacteria bacterium]
MKIPYFKIYLWLILISGLVIIGIETYDYFSKKGTDTKYIEPGVTDDIELDDVDIDTPDKPLIEDEDTTTKTETKTDTSTSKTTTTTSANWWEYPKTILPVTKSGNDLLVLVNKTYKLPSSYSPSDLVDVKGSKIRTKNNGTYLVRNIIISDLKKMNKAAIAEGVDLSVASAYRSYSTQKSTYNYWVSYNDGCVSCADKISARAGHSQHQLGTAIDFSTSSIHDAVGSSFTNTKAELWLKSNAYKYGFVISYPKNKETITGYSYESWHYRYIGVVNALNMHNEGVILELFLK